MALSPHPEVPRGIQISSGPLWHHPRWFLLPWTDQEAVEVMLLPSSSLAAQFPKLARICISSPRVEGLLCGTCVPVQKHNLVSVAPSSGRGDSPYRGLWFRGLGRSWGFGSLGESSGRRIWLSLAIEERELAGKAWGAACCIRVCVWSQALPLVLVSTVVETLTTSCSPEKNTAQNQRQFLPGRQLPGDTSPVLLFICLLFPRRLLFLCPCAL